MSQPEPPSQTGPEAPPSPYDRPALRPPQFGLKGLFWTTTLVAVAIVALSALSPMVASGVVLLVLAVGAHVVGNALGTRLRDHGNTPLPTADQPLRRERPQQHHFAPPTPLSHRQKMGRMMSVLSGAGAILGGGAGGALLALLNWEKVTVANMALATVSCAILGALVGFLGGSFVKVAFEAWWQAHRDSNAERSRR